jgi:hypothetical protein
VRPELVAAIRFFVRYHTGWIRDGMRLSGLRERRLSEQVDVNVSIENR